MALPNMTKGGAFKAPSTDQGFNHNHASQMAHAAQRRLAVARALSGGAKAPPMAAGAPHPAGNFKAHIAHGLAQKGVPVTMNHVHNAIDSLTAKGAFTPFQNQALKQHNGPLVGAPGQRTMGLISNELVNNPNTRKGM